MGEVGADGFDVDFPVCPICGTELQPKQSEVGRPVIQLVCERHGVQQIWDPLGDTGKGE